jgi:hypothetical protein
MGSITNTEGNNLGFRMGLYIFPTLLGNDWEQVASGQLGEIFIPAQNECSACVGSIAAENKKK